MLPRTSLVLEFAFAYSGQDAVAASNLVEVQTSRSATIRREVLKTSTSSSKGKVSPSWVCPGAEDDASSSDWRSAFPQPGRNSRRDRVVNKLGHDALFELRRKMGMLFQFGALFTDISSFDNVAFQMREHTNLPESIIRDLALMKLQAVGLRGAADLMPSELSGGMARRVALARSIALDPMLMMYDEPFTGLDPISLGVIGQLIRRLNDSLGATSIVVTHDVAEALELVDTSTTCPRKGRISRHSRSGACGGTFVASPIRLRRTRWAGPVPLSGAGLSAGPVRAMTGRLAELVRALGARIVDNWIWRLGFGVPLPVVHAQGVGPSFRRFHLTIREIYFTGVLSLIIILVSGLFVGMVLGLQGYDTLVRYGSSEALGLAALGRARHRRRGTGSLEPYRTSVS